MSVLARAAVLGLPAPELAGDAHGQVAASSAKLFPKENDGMMISAAHVMMGEQPSMRPDVPDSVLQDPGDLTTIDMLLNSLCQFDILYCLIVETEGKQDGGVYPAAVDLNQERADPAFDVVATDSSARAAMFPNSDNREIAAAMRRVFEYAEHEALRFRWGWRALPPDAQRFIRDELAEGT